MVVRVSLHPPEQRSDSAQLASPFVAAPFAFVSGFR